MGVSIFEIFKIGFGPSSSHTVGPMRAARLFVIHRKNSGVLIGVHRVCCSLHGSLGTTLFPITFRSADELLANCRDQGLSISK